MATKTIRPPESPTREWPPPQGEWTYEDWLQLPNDGMRYEVLYGVLYMSPSPSVAHQDAVSELIMLMRQYAKSNNLGLVLTSPIGVRLPEQSVPVQPDIIFVSKDRLDVVAEDYIEGAPDLIVEVLSPSNWHYDRGVKQEAYRQAGVREYWIVDYRAKTIEVLTLKAGIYTLLSKAGAGEKARSEVLAGFEVAAERLFS